MLPILRSRIWLNCPELKMFYNQEKVPTEGIMKLTLCEYAQISND